MFETNPEWNRCLDENGMTLGRCVYECGDNKDCEESSLKTNVSIASKHDK